MKLYCHPRWQTCKQTIRLIEEYGKEYEYYDLTKTSVDLSTLKELFAVNDYEIKKYFNTNGVEYRKQNIKEKLSKLSDIELLTLLSENGLLLKRPFIIASTLIIGKDEKKLMEEIKKWEAFALLIFYLHISLNLSKITTIAHVSCLQYSISPAVFVSSSCLVKLWYIPYVNIASPPLATSIPL